MEFALIAFTAALVVHALDLAGVDDIKDAITSMFVIAADVWALFDYDFGMVIAIMYAGSGLIATVTSTVLRDKPHFKRNLAWTLLFAITAISLIRA